MREILFRGQTRRYGEKVRMNGEKVPSQWAYGGVLQGIGDFSIIYGYDNPELKGEIQKWTVYTDTLGQYTGLTDKNGKRIFEGDIVRGRDALEKGLAVEGYIDYKYGSFCIVGDLMTHFRWMDYEVEVIGNIYDNPELIGGKEDGK